MAKYLLSQGEVLDGPGFQFIYDKMGPSVPIPTIKIFAHIRFKVLWLFLLIICNLTVSMGTVNGLIFYANIVWVNNANFLIPQRHLVWKYSSKYLLSS